MVKLVDVVKSYSGEKDAAVKGISLDIKGGEFLTILGPSGCGKTTTLRIIAGFENADSGSVLIDNKDVSSKAPYERNVNTVFQNYALFPHMDVFDNVAFGLTLKKLPKEDIDEKVTDMLKTVQMEGYEHRMPDQLSGGQKQRVAIARAIVNNPKVLLLDEPLGALDLKLRKQMQLELKHLQKKLGITFVFVTHDQEEAMTMSDRICVMNNGRIQQTGTPEEIYDKPKTKFVADFIGDTNIFDGTVTDSTGNCAAVRISDGQAVTLRCRNANEGDRICFAIRPERLKLKSSPENTGACIAASLKERTFIGSITRTILTLSNGSEIKISEPAGEQFAFAKNAQAAYITWNPDDAVVIDHD